jgi:hypothetical protein
LEHRYQQDLLRITELEKQLAEAQIVAEVADKRYDEVCQKLAVFENDLERNEERADTAEVYVNYFNLKNIFLIKLFFSKVNFVI